MVLCFDLVFIDLLQIDFSPVTTCEDKHLLFRKTLYIRRCLRVFHRREIGDHELSQVFFRVTNF